MNDIYGRLAQGGPTEIRANAQLTAGYVTTSAVELFSYAGICVQPIVGTSAVGTMYLKNRWSLDGTNYGDEATLYSVAATSGEIPISVSSGRFMYDMSQAGALPSMYVNRKGRYYQASVKWDASSAATVSINVLPGNNTA